MLTPEHLVCQFCGLSTSANSDDAKNWLVSQSCHYENIWIVRCPLHISEWALRQSRAGRTKEMRRKAEWGKRVWARTWGELPPVHLPLPSSFQGAETTGKETQVSESPDDENGALRPAQGHFRAGQNG